MKLQKYESEEILDFEERMKCQIIVNEVAPNAFRAHCLDFNILKRTGTIIPCMSYTYDSIDRVLASLAKEIGGEILVFNFDNSKKSFIAPDLIHTKVISK